jgi:GTPase
MKQLIQRLRQRNARKQETLLMYVLGWLIYAATGIYELMSGSIYLGIIVLAGVLMLAYSTTTIIRTIALRGVSQ